MKTLLTAILLVMAVPAMAATPTLNVTWDYPTGVEGLTGFTLYKDGAEVCSTNDPAARQFTCDTDIENRDYNFTMTAKGSYGRESEHSETYLYTPPAELFTPIDSPTNVKVITVNVTVKVMVK